MKGAVKLTHVSCCITGRRRLLSFSAARPVGGRQNDLQWEACKVLESPMRDDVSTHCLADGTAR